MLSMTEKLTTTHILDIQKSYTYILELSIEKWKKRKVQLTFRQERRRWLLPSIERWRTRGSPVLTAQPMSKPFWASHHLHFLRSHKWLNSIQISSARIRCQGKACFHWAVARVVLKLPEFSRKIWRSYRLSFTWIRWERFGLDCQFKPTKAVFSKGKTSGVQIFETVCNESIYWGLVLSGADC